MLALVHPDGRLHWVNRAYQVALGGTRDDRGGPPAIPEFGLGPDDRRRAEESLLSGSGWAVFSTTAVDGRVAEVAWAGVHLSDGTTVWIGQDVSDRKRAEEALRRSEAQLRHAQKMEAVGRLAGGIAHDFNNLLTTILGYGELLQDQIEPGRPLRREVDEVVRAGERAAALTGQLLAFSRKRAVEPRPVDPDERISAMAGMLARLLGERVEIRSDLTTAGARVLVDPGHFDQVVLNLAVNARDAMPKGGVLGIRTRRVVVEPGDANSLSGLAAGEYVEIVVTDSGIGMSDDVLRRIFEPFFTTKERSKGTGLGLATVYGIVTQSGGTVSARSRPGEGSAFTILLPCHRGRDRGASRPEAALRAVGSETILLVEDDEQVRDLARRALEVQGYRVLSARHAADALAQSRRHSGPVHLLLTDVIMPGLAGPELAKIVRSERPETRVLFMSGYTDAEILAPDALAGEAELLHKPFTPATLGERVQEALRYGDSNRNSETTFR